MTGRQLPHQAVDRKRFHTVTFGCQMNKHDSERVAGMLVAAGHTPVDAPEEADIILFNTCAVREHAAQRLYGRVGAMKSLKRKNPALVIAIGGCLAQKEGGELLQRLPHADVVFGTFNLSGVPSLIDAAAKGERLWRLQKDYDGLPSDLPLLRHQEHHAWVTVSVGCNNFCSYCIVPYVRGREISRPIEEVCDEVQKLATEGVAEITLLGQNVNSYGTDIYGRSRFADLLSALDSVSGLKRIRFATSHPKDLTGDIVEAVSQSEKTCEHFHLPVQSGSDRILRHMNRKYGRDQYARLAEMIRDRIPGASITTDIIVGYPGETEADFEGTLSLVERVQFDQAFTFIFSAREGTRAAAADDQVSGEVKRERFGRLVAVQTGIGQEKNRALIGRSVEVLVEGPSRKNEALMTGRTRTNKVVNFPGKRNLRSRVVPVLVKEARPWHLMGIADDRRE